MQDAEPAAYHTITTHTSPASCLRSIRESDRFITFGKHLIRAESCRFTKSRSCPALNYRLCAVWWYCAAYSSGIPSRGLLASRIPLIKPSGPVNSGCLWSTGLQESGVETWIKVISCQASRLITISPKIRRDNLVLLGTERPRVRSASSPCYSWWTKLKPT